MLRFKEVLLLVAAGICVVLGEETLNVILVGATGDLSRKYLWRSLVDVSRDRSELRIFGGARADEDVGREIVDEIVRKVYDENGSYDDEYEDNFKRRVRYAKLAKCEDYEKLCRIIDSENSFQEDYCHLDEKVDCRSVNDEKGRLFYLSIPPFSYPEVVDCISRFCKPRNDSSTWLRIVLEKPFGHDMQSVNSLVEQLLANFQDDQLYPVDHYLGKAAVRAILPFRMLNRDWLDPLMNADHVERIEIFVAEEDDVKGRINYYDRYGALLDMVQNHLMEVLQSLAADLPDGPPSPALILQEKLHLLNCVERVQPVDLLLGQHDKYRDYAKEELKDPDWDGRTNTVAAVRVSLSGTRWSNVPFVLFAGKSMPLRTSYAKVIFKSNALCIGNDRRCPSASGTLPAEIVFEINAEGGGRPKIRISKGISGDEVINVPPSWKAVADVGDNRNNVFEYAEADSAYTLLLKDAVDGRRESFVATTNLLASWTIWEDVLKVLGTVDVTRYPQKSIDRLEIRGRSLSLPGFPKDNDYDFKRPRRFSLVSRGEGPQSEGPRGEGTVLPWSNLYDRLARDFIHAARDSIASQGVFHAAVPGGTTPLPFYRTLRNVAQDLGFSKWSSVHLWFTDERCVPYHHADSNFKAVNDALLRTVSIPAMNVHPMPVVLAKGPCHPEDDGALAYERALKSTVTGSRFDYVLLGVGADGHVASLFPGDATRKSGGSALVALTNNVESKRMSLTFSAINSARQVAIAVVGKGKRDVLRKVCSGTWSVEDLPVMGVEPEKSPRWFVDEDAFQGSGCS